jgi:hypothetical protein
MRRRHRFLSDDILLEVTLMLMIICMGTYMIYDLYFRLPSSPSIVSPVEPQPVAVESLGVDRFDILLCLCIISKIPYLLKRIFQPIHQPRSVTVRVSSSQATSAPMCSLTKRKGIIVRPATIKGGVSSTIVFLLTTACCWSIKISIIVSPYK